MRTPKAAADKAMHVWYHQSPKSQAMVILGIIWCFIGMGVLDGIPSTTDGALHLMFPSAVWMMGWVGTGMFAIIAAITRRHKSTALGALQFMPVIRVVSYSWSWLMCLFPGAPEGDPNGWYRAIIQSVLVLAVWITSHLPSVRDYSQMGE